MVCVGGMPELRHVHARHVGGRWGHGNYVSVLKIIKPEKKFDTDITKKKVERLR